MKKEGKAILAAAIFVMGMATIPASIATSENEDGFVKMASMQGWVETFDSYETGQFLDGTPDDGGWKGWDNDPTFGAYVTGDYFVSSPHSVEIAGPTDLVHEYSGYTSGKWTYYAQQYIPDDFEGETYFILLSYYEDGGGQEINQWAVQIRFDSDDGIVEAEYDGDQLPLITGRWVELRVEIDLDEDWFEFYYDGVLLTEKEWTAGPNNDYAGLINIGAIDLYANGATPVYYDNLALVEAGKFVGVSGSLSWADVKPGTTVTGEFTVQNLGPPGSVLNWEIESYPDWGTWTFTPSSGDGLKPEDGPVTVQVEVVAPSQKNTEFSGEIKVVNKDNSEDFGIIQVSLATPLNKNSFILQFLEMLLQRFPLLERIFSLLPLL